MFFGGNTSYFGRISPTSPNKSPGWGNVCSPFKTTQMPLQEITMNQTSVPKGTSLKSPGKGSNPPAGARTMKDYEDHLEALKRENFQLKLRVFFLEERIGMLGSGNVDEDPVKKNIELKVELEAMKKELVEKQELLSQAAKAFELHEEQKEVTRRNQAQYEQSLQNERQRIVELEKELEEYRSRMTDSSIFYQEAFGISPEMALENKDKLNQMEEVIESLEAQVRQLTSSLDEERTWGQEIESERDQLKTRLEEEIQAREKLTVDKDLDIECLREKVRELEEEAFKRESVTQQYKTELAEKDRVIKEKTLLLEEKCRACDEFNALAEKRKKQVDQLRASIKSRDEALVDSNNKYRTLLHQFENKRLSPPSSPSTYNDVQSVRSSLRSGQIISPSRVCMSPFDWDINRRGKEILASETQSISSDNSKELKELTKQLEDKEREIQKQDEEKKQLILKLCNVQQTSDSKDKELKKLKPAYEKALKMVQKFCVLESKRMQNKERKNSETSAKKSDELLKYKKMLREQHNLDYAFSVDLDDQVTQQRFDEMETKINDLRDEIASIKAEKCKLEQQIHEESEELRNQLKVKQKEIEDLVKQRDQVNRELEEKESKIRELEEHHKTLEEFEELQVKNVEEMIKLKSELADKRAQVNEQNEKIDQLSKDLQIKTQNLQKLVNTELWNKNKEIAKLHNHMTDKNRSNNQDNNSQDSSKLDTLLKELRKMGVDVTFNDDDIKLNYLKNGGENIDIKTLTKFVEQLNEEKRKLQNEIDSLTWFKLMSKTNSKMEIGEEMNEVGNPKAYCELLRTHLKGLVKFMSEVLKSPECPDESEQKKIILEFLENTKILSVNLAEAIAKMSLNPSDPIGVPRGDAEVDQIQAAIDKDNNHHHHHRYNQGIRESEQSDSETFSEPDRGVSFARIGLQGTESKVLDNGIYSDSEEESLDYYPCHRAALPMDGFTFQQPKPLRKLEKLVADINVDVNSVRNELVKRSLLDRVLEERLHIIMSKLETCQDYCQKINNIFQNMAHECFMLNRDNECYVERLEIDRKMLESKNRSAQLTVQRAEDRVKKYHADMVKTCSENFAQKSLIKRLQKEVELLNEHMTEVRKEYNRLNLTHSQVLVENTKLTNEKLKLEQEMRKSDNNVRSLHDKFNKEITELGYINDSHRSKIQDLDDAAKELRRVACETSDSAPSSSGVSSLPIDATLSKPCDDIMQEDFPSYSSSQYWLPSYPSSSGRSKSSCSPDLGIESDTAMSTRPLKDTLKITESMTNLLSDEENCNANRTLRDLDRESPLHIEGLDEVEALKAENEALKRRLMKTRKALEETFEHLSASNKNKKNVEKAITKQLMITKSILNKTRTFDEEPFQN